MGTLATRDKGTSGNQATGIATTVCDIRVAYRPGPESCRVYGRRSQPGSRALTQLSHIFFRHLGFPRRKNVEGCGFEEWDWLARLRASRETSLKFVPPAYSSEPSLVQTNSDTRTRLQQ